MEKTSNREQKPIKLKRENVHSHGDGRQQRQRRLYFFEFERLYDKNSSQMCKANQSIFYIPHFYYYYRIFLSSLDFSQIFCRAICGCVFQCD